MGHHQAIGEKKRRGNRERQKQRRSRTRSKQGRRTDWPSNRGRGFGRGFWGNSKTEARMAEPEKTRWSNGSQESTFGRKGRNAFSTTKDRGKVAAPGASATEANHRKAKAGRRAKKSSYNTGPVASAYERHESFWVRNSVDLTFGY